MADEIFNEPSRTWCPDPDDESNTDVTIHRLCMQDRDKLSIFFAPGRHIDAFRAAQGAGFWSLDAFRERRTGMLPIEPT